MKSIFFVVLCLFSQWSFARVAKPADLPWWIESVSYDIMVHKDGTFSTIETTKIHIENEAGRSAQSVQNFLFRPLNEKLELIEAYTLTAGKKLKVEKENISIESGGNNRPGFDA